MTTHPPKPVITKRNNTHTHATHPPERGPPVTGRPEPHHPYPAAPEPFATAVSSRPVDRASYGREATDRNHEYEIVLSQIDSGESSSAAYSERTERIAVTGDTVSYIERCREG